MDIASRIRDVPDFPVAGVLFKDITTLLRDAQGFQSAVDALAEHYVGEHIDIVAAIEARGFIFGAPLAYKFGVGFVPVRKAGKLPASTLTAEYSLEYGTSQLQVHTDAIEPGQKVLVVDDLLATGGSAKAAIDLVEQLGGEVVGAAFLIELGFLHGIDKLEGYQVFSVVRF